MNGSQILNVFRNVPTEHLSEEQKREFAELLARYLDSYEFACHLKNLLARWG